MEWEIGSYTTGIFIISLLRFVLQLAEAGSGAATPRAVDRRRRPTPLSSSNAAAVRRRYRRTSNTLMAIS